MTAENQHILEAINDLWITIGDKERHQLTPHTCLIAGMAFGASRDADEKVTYWITTDLLDTVDDLHMNIEAAEWKALKPETRTTVMDIHQQLHHADD